MSATATMTVPASAAVEQAGQTLQMQNHRALIDHHAAHTQGAAGRRLNGDAAVTGLWQAPAPSLGVPGGDRHASWSNPDWWPEQRGTPAHRPIDYNLDFTRSPWANGIPETIFTVSMIGIGVQTIGLVNTAWRATFGRVESLSNRMRYQCPHEL